METIYDNRGAGLYMKELPRVMSKVYSLMSIGLLLTAIAAYVVADIQFMRELILGNIYVYFGLIIGELVLVIGLSARRNKISSATAKIGFIMYSIVNGLTLSAVFLVYDLGMVANSFLVCCITFGAMSLYGYNTKTDLTSMGKYMVMGLIGVVIGGFVNFFIMNDTFSFFITIIGLIVFIGLTAYHTQSIKQQLNNAASEEEYKKVAIFGALILYLDFINLFLKILRLMSKKR